MQDIRNNKNIEDVTLEDLKAKFKRSKPCQIFTPSNTPSLCLQTPLAIKQA